MLVLKMWKNFKRQGSSCSHLWYNCNILYSHSLSSPLLALTLSVSHTHVQAQSFILLKKLIKQKAVLKPATTIQLNYNCLQLRVLLSFTTSIIIRITLFKKPILNLIINSLSSCGPSICMSFCFLLHTRRSTLILLFTLQLLQKHISKQCSKIP